MSELSSDVPIKGSVKTAAGATRVAEHFALLVLSASEQDTVAPILPS